MLPQSQESARMCFSAEASFTVAAILLPAGVYCTSVAVRKRPTGLPLAIIPLVFSLQQFAEGLPAFELMPHSWWDAGYGALVLFPFFIASPGQRFAAFRVLLAVSAAVSFLLFRYAFVSVWCFFAAMLSAQLCWTFSGLGTH